MNYDGVYNKRLNRFGDTYESRIQGQRASDFNYYRQSSIYKVNFRFNYSDYLCVLEPNKQDATETTAWLLSRLEDNFKGGDVLSIKDKTWMIMYQKDSVSAGYNKYLVIKLTHMIKWKDRQGKERSSPAYFYGKMDRIIYDVIRSTAKNPDYNEPNKETHIVMPSNEYLKRQDYILIDGEGFNVIGYDKSSTPGVTYYSLVQTYERNTEAAPQGTTDDYFWFGGNA